MAPLLFVTAMLVVGCSGSPRLRYPLFYLSPEEGPNSERVALVPRAEDPRDPPIISNRISLTTDASQEELQVSQFHTQDARGRVLFGFRSPDQVRMEARDHDGTVRGTYSYVDPFGQVIKMEYWDDGEGFHTSGNNLPIAWHEPPQYTPEVAAAREHHFKLYQQALNAAKYSPPKEEDESYSEMPDEESPDEELDDDSDSVVLEDEPSNEEQVDALSQYPKVQSPQSFISPTFDAFDDDLESISIDNPDLRPEDVPLTRFWQRRGKSQNFGAGNENPQRSYDNVRANGDQREGKAFFYQFQHYVPIPMYEDDTRNEGTRHLKESISQGAVEAGAIPVAAVHDTQVSLNQRTGVSEHQTKPLYLGQESPVVSQRVAEGIVKEVHDTQVSPLQKGEVVPQIVSGDSSDQFFRSKDSVSQRAADSDRIPVAAVHDAQVSPLQQGSIPNHQIKPVYNYGLS